MLRYKNRKENKDNLIISIGVGFEDIYCYGDVRVDFSLYFNGEFK